jgi:hypothetical protein
MNNTTPANVPLETLSIASLAKVVRRDWGLKVNFAAKPYLDAMMSLETVNDNFGYDDGRSIVNYFLSNATTWRGPVAKAVKAELNKRVKAR